MRKHLAISLFEKYSIDIFATQYGVLKFIIKFFLTKMLVRRIFYWKLLFFSENLSILVPSFWLPKLLFACSESTSNTRNTSSILRFVTST